MARHPSVALRVLLAALLAAGPLPTRLFAAGEPPPRTEGEPGAGFVVLKVGTAVNPVYGAVMIRSSQLQGMKPGDEREVEALFPKAMKNLGRKTIFGISIPLSAYHYAVDASAERVTVKLAEGGRSLGKGRWQLSRGGEWLGGKTPTSYTGCVPDGDERCFEAIRGVARSFDVAATPAPRPAPQPAPRPDPQPNPQPRPNPQPNPQPRPNPEPTPEPTPPSVAETLKDWSFVETPDGVFALGKATFEGARTRAAACPEGYVTVPLYKLAFAADQPGKPLSAAAEDQGLLKLYKPNEAGSPMAWCPKGRDCAADGVDVPAKACDAVKCPGLTIDRPAESKAGTALRPADLERPFEAKAGGQVVSGKAVVAPTASEKCSSQTPDPLAEKLKKLFGDDKAGLTLARLAAKVWTDKDETFEAALDKALADPEKGKAAFLEKASKAILADGGKAAIAALKADAALMADFKAYHCAGTPEQAVAAADKSAKTKEELEKTQAQGGGRLDTGGKSTPGVAAEPLPPGNPYEAICRILNDSGNTTRRPGDSNTTPPPAPGEGRPAVTSEDKEDKTKAEAEAKAAAKKKDLQRMAIGGMGGAIVLGVFGFIFGGPIGALAMGALGFGIMAGVTYMNNHPIE